MPITSDGGLDLPSHDSYNADRTKTIQDKPARPMALNENAVNASDIASFLEDSNRKLSGDDRPGTFGSGTNST